MSTPSHSPAVPDVVTCRGVSKTFGVGRRTARTVLQDIDFSVADLPGRGELIAMLGPSGCGKSTLLNIIAGLEPAFPQTTGEVLVRGKVVTGPGRDRGMVFQRYSSFPQRTVLGNVLFGLELLDDEELRGLGVPSGRGALEDYAMSWLRRVHLEESAYKYPHQLSGGMQQRVAIARTLALHPRIILMDEPFSALDEPTRLEMQDLLVELWAKIQATVFMVSHSINEAVYLGDRIWIFTPAPGTIGHVVTDLPERKAPAEVMQRSPEFRDAVKAVAETFQQVMTAKRAPR